MNVNKNPTQNEITTLDSFPLKPLQVSGVLHKFKVANLVRFVETREIGEAMKRKLKRGNSGVNANRRRNYPLKKRLSS